MRRPACEQVAAIRIGNSLDAEMLAANDEVRLLHSLIILLTHSAASSPTNSAACSPTHDCTVHSSTDTA